MESFWNIKTTLKPHSRPDNVRRELLKAHDRIFCDCWYLSINLTDFCTGNSRKRSQRCVWKRISQVKRMPWVMFSAELDFSCWRPWRVSQRCSQSSICLFVLLRAPECMPAAPLTMTNRILQSGRTGFGSVLFAPFIPSLSNIDRDDEWGSEVSLCLSEPDTTWLVL